MYLKSLTLRGFKSFADKTKFEFDPGLTVVVGPNGSGKSNVSDAILWVLGEQSAKALRGQAMEDVIFAGSSARRSVGMAEVTLVLDNTDGTLPVDFTEVAITRRMYRSGESEYLINGAVSRLMDVTDILHDSGIGRDMHSIISQGHLDAILSSKAEERRELIEEAAGISKHRRRKIRSERKLKSMDESLQRAKDINREVQRQLRPLERQVGKAKRAREIQDRLHEAMLILAVDDLRNLQERHGAVSAQLREAEAELSLRDLRVNERTAELERYQSLLEQKGIFVGDLSAQRMRLSNQISRLESDLRLLGQKAQSMEARAVDLAEVARNSERDRKEAASERDEVSRELAEARGQWDELKRQLDELTTKANRARGRRKDYGMRLAKAQGDLRAAQRRSDQETLAHAKLSDQVSNSEVEDQLFASRLEQIDEQIDDCDARIAERKARKEELSESLAQARKQASEARERIHELQRKLGDVRSQEQKARESLAQAKANLSALEAVDAQAANTSPLVGSLMANRSVTGLVECRLADLIEVPSELEDLVERLLGDDLAALVVATADDAERVAKTALDTRAARGKATVMRRDVRGLSVPTQGAGTALVDKLKVDESAREVVSALLGDVRIVNTAHDAIIAHDDNPALTYVTTDGLVALPDGRVVIGAGEGSEKGALERKRRIRALRAALPEQEAKAQEAAQRVAACEADITAARDADAKAKGDVARLQGEHSSTSSEIGRLEAQRSSARVERDRVSAKRVEAQKKVEKARQQIVAHREAAQKATKDAEDLAVQVEELTSQRSEASHQEADADRKVADARLRLATVQERKNHLITREDDLVSRIRRQGQRAEAAAKDVLVVTARQARIAPLETSYRALLERARAWQARLEDRATLAEADSASLKQTIGDARDAVEKARKEHAQVVAKTGELRVEQGRLEAQVGSGVEAVEALGEDLAKALSLPAPEDRDALEIEVAELRKSLASIGPVNEVAMDEYARLKQRGDYIAEQVADLEAARKSLQKITVAIDRKMRKQFMDVYDKVNENFTHMFSLLFPGGHAHLELTDPDDVFQTGVEVIAQPRGKKLQKMMLMSGGEKSLTALALLFAVYRTRTVPFYVFDEVEAALDDSNLGKLLDAIDELRATTQLIVISHQRRTMEQADVLYGVSMQADGVSHVVSQRLDKTTGRMVDA